MDLIVYRDYTVNQRFHLLQSGHTTTKAGVAPAAINNLRSDSPHSLAPTKLGLPEHPGRQGLNVPTGTPSLTSVFYTTGTPSLTSVFYTNGVSSFRTTLSSLGDSPPLGVPLYHYSLSLFLLVGHISMVCHSTQSNMLPLRPRQVSL